MAGFPVNINAFKNNEILPIMETLALELEKLEWNELKTVLVILAKKTKKGILRAGKSNLKEYCQKIAAKLLSPGYEKTLREVLDFMEQKYKQAA